MDGSISQYKTPPALKNILQQTTYSWDCSRHAAIV
jgi:hypothetical protein